MNNTLKFSLVLLGTSLFLGCSGKNISLQNYADTWFNETSKIQHKTDNTKAHQSDAAIQSKETELKPQKNPAADIAWSSTSKGDVHNKGEGSLQKRLDKWTEEEWKPAFQGDKEQAKKDEAANEHFTFQHYYDKSKNYLEKKERENEGEEKEPSHYEKMQTLPVIGK